MESSPRQEEPMTPRRLAGACGAYGATVTSNVLTVNVGGPQPGGWIWMFLGEGGFIPFSKWFS